MKVCIYGAGAIGGFIGGHLALAGEAEVSAIARGATLQALQRDGWRIRDNGELLQAPAHATDDPATLGVQDVVVIAVKGPALPVIAARLAPLIGDDTIVLPAMNGVPWWFGNGAPAMGTAPLESVDPGGKVAAAIGFQHVLGCVVHISTSTSEPGLVEHKMGHGLIVGEPLGGTSTRADALAALLKRARFDATVSSDIRRDIWYKLWGNLTMNPVSAITGATIDLILADPLVLGFCSAAMREASAIGARIGCAIEQRPEDRHQITKRLGAFKSSMLQDAEAGRPMELDSIVGVVREIAQRLDMPVPNIDAVFGLARLFGQVHGLYPKPA